MAEEEALKKWCPMVRHATCDFNGSSNRDHLSDFSGYHCMGSKCMMWVEEPVYKDGENLASIVMGGRCGLVNK